MDGWMKENFNIKGEVIFVVPRLVPAKPKCSAPQLGNMCHPTLGGPVNNGFSQEQVVVT